MKNVTICLALVCLVAVSSCSKSSSPQSIVGSWSLSNISGTIKSYNTSTDGSTTTITYNASINTISSTTVQQYGTTTQTVPDSSISVTGETWNFKSDGTYTINEVYTYGSSPSVTSATSSTWEYLSNSQANNAFLLDGGGSQVLGLLNNNSNQSLYTISSIKGNVMTLENVSSQSNSQGQTYNSDVVVTLTKSN